LQNPRILIIGAGPTGLGAAHRLTELGHQNWLLFEKFAIPGGLASSVTDKNGFTWDLGGHVQFSHYPYFDQLMDDLLGHDGWLHHQRESWIWMRDRFIPYPFQLNLHHLPTDEARQCLDGLIHAHSAPTAPSPVNFGQWIDTTFGPPIAASFMRPYNYKVWAYPPEELNTSWTGDRVAVANIEKLQLDFAARKDNISWGPNKTFRFPKTGGTGAIWRVLASRLPFSQIRYRTEVLQIDTSAKTITLNDGSTETYDYLLNTGPLDKFLQSSDLPQLAATAARLKHSSTHIFGIGLQGQPPPHFATKCWIYFPEDNSPFYRVTVFSNYSPGNVPDPAATWSLMAEVSESPQKSVPATAEARLQQVIQGLLNTRLVRDPDSIISTWQTRLEYGYPTPSLQRDSIIYDILPQLDALHIGSRGRFGAWRYEVSNQDHSLMQGVEWVDNILNNQPETTLWHPEIINISR